MIEEIKKEIRTTCMIYLITPHPNVSKPDNRNEEEIREDVASTLKLIDKILDKYNSENDYLIVDKKMFSKRLNNQLCNDYEPDCEDYWLAGLEDRANKGEAYMKAWEEAKEQMGDGTFPISYSTMQELSKKYGLEE